MRLVYPSNPLRPREPDDLYAEEYSAALDSGFEASVFSYEGLADGSFRPRPNLAPDDTVLYRGWMLTPEEFGQLSIEVQHLGARMLTSPEQYVLCHHLPRWYPALAEFTPETRFFAETDDVATQLQALGWTGCFLKDYVKSLTTSGGSFVHDLSRIPEVLAQMKKHRGKIEGGICARRIEAFDPDTEDRYFVFRGKPHGRSGMVPEVVEVAARRIDSPFFTVDTIRRRDGTTRIVELGDGQVSDRKKWTAQQLVRLFGSEPKRPTSGSQTS
jgi:hypothetical protein